MKYAIQPVLKEISEWLEQRGLTEPPLHGRYDFDSITKRELLDLLVLVVKLHVANTTGKL